MQITWNGQSCFTIKSKKTTGEELTVMVNPFDENKVNIKLPKTQANIVLANDKNIKLNSKKLGDNFFLINNPGEFEVSGVFINGIANNWTNKNNQKNIFFFLEIESVKILNLGDINCLWKNDFLDKLPAIDILMIPADEENFNIEKTIEIINEIEPKIIIPTNFKITGINKKLSSIKKFANKMGVDAEKQIDKLKITKKNLPQDNTEIIIMSKK